MKPKIWLTLTLVTILILSLLTPISMAAGPTLRIVYGKVVVNDAYAPDGAAVRIVFPNTGTDVTNDTFTDQYTSGNYVMNFMENDFEEGTFSVRYQGTWYEPIPAILEIEPGEIEYNILLEINTSTSPQTNNAPFAPSNPDPDDGDTGVSRSKNLGWDCSDPDGDPLTFDIYFGTTSPPPLVKSGHGSKSYDPGNMAYETTYYWQIVAWDNKSSYTEGPIWTFKTGKQSSPPSGGGGGGFFNPGTPVADASNGEPYTGNVDEAILFDGTLSNDSDGTIVTWAWNFGNNDTGSGETYSYTYTQPGTYTVTLTVIDNDGLTDTDTTTATIIQPNRPPTQPIITGPHTGTKDTEYDFTITSTDADDDQLQYEVDWDDGDTDQSAFLPNGTAYNTEHTWTAAGLYTISVEVTDNQTTSTASHHILIDSIFVKNIGYLMDTDGDGTYDTFYSNTTGEETDATTEDDKASYLLDENGDDTWDWQYYPETGELLEYEGEPAGADEIDWSLWILLLILIIVIVVLLALVNRSNKKKKGKKSTEKKSGDSKKK